MNTILYLTMLISVGLIAVVRAKAHNAVKTSNDADISCYYRKRFAIIRFAIFCMASIVIFIVLANLDKVEGLTIGLVSGWGSICLLMNFPASAIRPSQLKDKYNDGVAAPPPRFRESSLRSRPKGFNRITHF